MQGANVVPRGRAMSTLHLGPVKKCILVGREEEEPGRGESAEQMKDIILIMGLEPVQVPYILCVRARVCMCDRWEDVKAPLPLMLKPAL